MKTVATTKCHRILILVALLSLTACATHYTDATVSDPYGFFSGLLHGIIFPIVLIAKVGAWFLQIFNIHLLGEVQFIGRPNTGFLFYYVGYVIGLSAWSGTAT